MNPILPVLWLFAATSAPPVLAGDAVQLLCGEVVAAVGQGASPRWQLTGNLRANHRDTPRLTGSRNLIEGCMAGRFDAARYSQVFRDGYEAP